LQTAHHNILRQNVNLGTLSVKSNAQDLSSTSFIIKNKGNIIYHDKINKPVQILEGRYSIEVLTMPRMYFPDKMINGNDNNISIPDPGKLSINYSNGYVGALFARREDNKEEWLTNISSNTSSNEIYTLLPGNYFLVLRKKSEKSIESSKTIDFIINSNTTKSISLD
jgi:Ca-activated chloride channel family protein